MQVKKVTYFGEFSCLNKTNSVTYVLVGFRPPSWCPSRWTPAWRLHTTLYVFGLNISSDISSGNLSEEPCIFTSFHFPYSGLYLLTLVSTGKFIPLHHGTRGWGGRWNPSPEFFICCSILKQWLLSWPPPWILPRIRNQVQIARNGIFCALHEK